MSTLLLLFEGINARAKKYITKLQSWKMQYKHWKKLHLFTTLRVQCIIKVIYVTYLTYFNVLLHTSVCYCNIQLGVGQNINIPIRLLYRYIGSFTKLKPGCTTILFLFWESRLVFEIQLKCSLF